MSISLYIAIVNRGQDKKLIKIAHENGLSGATVLQGQGTIRHGLLSILGLTETKKNIILLAASSDIGDVAMEQIAEQMHMEKPNHGIIFSIQMSQIFGSKQMKDETNEDLKEKTMEYQAIFTIVDRGRAEEVIDSVCAVGAKGGTIINARGAGIHETQKVFNIPIEPEKEMVLIIAQVKDVDRIRSAIQEDMHIDEPGQGIIFIMDIAKVYGLFDQNK